MIFRIHTPKPPEDVWPVVVDFSARLDTAGGEKIVAADAVAYRREGYEQVLADIDLTDAYRVQVCVERHGQEAKVYSYPVAGQPSLRLLLPKEYPKIFDPYMVTQDDVVIGPPEGREEPPATRVMFRLRNGEPGSEYEVHVIAVTNKANVHTCLLRFRVEELA